MKISIQIIFMAVLMTVPRIPAGAQEPEKPYVPAYWLSKKDNDALASTATTSGSFVTVRFTGFLAEAGQIVAARLLGIALRRYGAATLFDVRYGNQIFDYPYQEERWTYNRVRQTLTFDARDESEPWSHQFTAYKITDAAVSAAADAKKPVSDSISFGGTLGKPMEKPKHPPR